MSSFIGILLATLTAILKSSSEILAKFTLLQEVDEYVVSWALRFFALPAIIIGVFIFGVPDISTKLWIAVAITIPSSVAATVLYMKAIQASDLSVISPLAGISPALVLLSSPFIVGEFPSVIGLVGVMTTTVGLYILKLHKASAKHFFRPFKALVNEPGARYMALMLIIYSLTAPIDKVGVEASSPVFYTFITHLGQVLILTLLMVKFSNEWKNIINKDRKKILAIGLLSGLSSIIQMTALTFTLVVYVISVKRAGILISVLAGHFIFKEENIKERLLGASIIISGLAIIALTESGIM